jgi:hypothetical protein
MTLSGDSWNVLMARTKAAPDTKEEPLEKQLWKATDKLRVVGQT